MTVKEEELEFYDAQSARALISPEGNTLVLEITSGDNVIRFGLKIDAARELMHQMSVAASASLKDPTAAGGPGFVRMTQVNYANAHPTEEAGKISLGLMDDLEIPHYFVLKTQTSASLRRQLRSAEVRAAAGSKVPKA